MPERRQNLLRLVICRHKKYLEANQYFAFADTARALVGREATLCRLV